MVIIGSARHDENNKYSGGAKGDSLQTSTPDYKGEVSMQNFYLHKKGWYVVRAIKPADAKKIAERMQTACNNKNIGYSQSDRLAIIKDGIDTQKPSNCDCSSLVRECVKEATGKDPGNFTTYNAVGCLENTKLFIPAFPYTSTTVLQTGDILCTQTKGHIVIVVNGSTSTGQYTEPTRLIISGSRGDDVKWVQDKLNKFGYNLTVDGIAGNKTTLAIMDFQKKHSLEVDGECGKLTRAELKKGG